MALVNQVGEIERAGKRAEVFANRYRQIRALSSGADGQVFLVEDAVKGGWCALKLLPPQYPSARVQAEFARLSEIAHPAIVPVLDAGILSAGPATGRAFLVTTYLAGPTLADSLPVEPVEARLAQFSLAAEALADALAYLHGRGVLHGDISPANIRCDESGRPVLIDFGLAKPFLPSVTEKHQAVAGTLGFIAPEALLGERGPAGDIFALGATLYDAWAGAPPFGLGLEAIRRVWQAPPDPSALYPGLPAAWDRLLLAMVAAAAGDRPASAREVLQEIRRVMPGRPTTVEVDLSPPFPGGDPFAGVLVGRATEEARLRHRLEQLAQAAATSSLVCVVGPPGSGRHALIRQALREARLAVLAQTIDAFDIEETEWSKLVPRSSASGARDAIALPEPMGSVQAQLAAVVEGLEQRAGNRPLCLSLAGSLEDEALARALASSPSSGRLLVLLPCDRPPELLGAAPSAAAEAVMAIPLAPLARDAVAELFHRVSGRPAPTDILDRVMAASAGLPALAVLLIRRWLKAEREGLPQPAAAFTADHDDLAELLDASFAALSAEARTFVLTAALSDAAPMGAAAASSGMPTGEGEARAAGWLHADGVGLSSEAHLSALWRALPRHADLRRAAEQSAERLGEGDMRLAEVQLALGQPQRATNTFWQAMRAAAARMAWSKVAVLGLRARAVGATAATAPDALVLANALGILGRYEEALAVLDGCVGWDTTAVRAPLLERKAWILGRQGALEDARALLEDALRQLPGEGEAAMLLRARLARMLVASGRYDEAFAAAKPALAADSPSGMAARESAVLALAYTNQLDAAERILDGLRSAARNTADSTLLPRLTALAGLVRQLAGRPQQAAESYRSALAGYERVHERHGAATATFNLGCTLAELGDYAEAIPALERAVRELGRLGAANDQALAVFNVGQLFLQLGDLVAAARAIERLQAHARATGRDGLHGYAQLLTAELRRRHHPAADDAARAYAEAAMHFAGAGMHAMAAMAKLGQAESVAELQRASEARALLAELEAAHASLVTDVAPPLSPMGEALLLARGRVARVDAAATGEELGRTAEALAGAAQVAERFGRLPSAMRMARLAAGLFARSGDSRRDMTQTLAQRLLEEVKMKTPAKYWPGLTDDDEAKVLPIQGGAGHGAALLAERAAVLESRLRRLLRINKRLNSELRLSRVLETVIDTVIELTDAERGFLLLNDGNGELTVKVARNIDQTTLEGTGTSLSRTIAKQAADTGQPVITVDAAGDSRFAEQLSVSDLHLRSVLAVPLTVKGMVVGTIYVDHRLRKGVFGDDEVAMVLDFAEQGAIAIENARVIAELRRREQQVQSLNRRLERELRLQEAALSQARVELKETRQAAALRYDYGQIVGQSPAMLDLFRLLDRVTDTQLPVVIEGESGTGKELVARAIHFHGSRKDKPFVSENCAAIPETLLESALFGHVRGAFTGAERETRGLFAIANGGTLFLDEVADMSPAMQGKLLRVLQDGEFHRVGSERAEKADVRVLVASNRNLAQMVEDGKFRKDLFYRLSVIRLHLPPLRERREDIPLLLRHFLERFVEQTGGAVKGVEPAALMRLCAHAWPGNVRELENEVAKAAAFSGPTIAVGDLSPHIQAGVDPSETIRNEPDSLRLRQRVERLERQLIREAMNRSQGNQTRAALLLGLSRFGLQKKLRRYSLAG